jgi:hypothetical protein
MAVAILTVSAAREDVLSPYVELAVGSKWESKMELNESKSTMLAKRG